MGEGGTVLEACQRATGLTPNKARALLGRFLFSGEEAEKPVAGLSGGERRRLALAILVQSGANVLILDEPTNHLDLESREALEDALHAFPGTVLLVSHDRALLDAVGARTIAIEDGELRSHAGRLGRLRARARGAPGAGAAAARRPADGAAERRRERAADRERRRPVQERGARPRGARARDRGGRGGARGAGGGARGPAPPGPSPDRAAARDRAPRARPSARSTSSTPAGSPP